VKILAEGIFGVISQMMYDKDLEENMKVARYYEQTEAGIHKIFGNAVGHDFLVSGIKGQVVMWSKEKAWYVPVPNALVYFELPRPNPYNSESFYTSPPFGMSPVYNWNRAFSITDENGTFMFPAVIDVNRHSYTYIEGWIINETTGEPLYAPDHGIHSLPQYGWHSHMQELREPIAKPFIRDVGKTPIFKCSSLILFDIISPDEGTMPISTDTGVPLTAKISIMEAATDTPPEAYCLLTKEDLTFAAFPPEESVEFMVKFGVRRYPVLFIDNRTTSAKGAGYKLKVGEQRVLTHSISAYAEQLWLLNDERLKNLVAVDPIELQSLYGRLHKQTEEIIQLIKDNIANHKYSEAYALSLKAWNNEYLVYLYVRPKLEDLAYSITYLAPFLVPFAFLAEKLLFGQHGLNPPIYSRSSRNILQVDQIYTRSQNYDARQTRGKSKHGKRTSDLPLIRSGEYEEIKVQNHPDDSDNCISKRLLDLIYFIHCNPYIGRESLRVWRPGI